MWFFFCWLLFVLALIIYANHESLKKDVCKVQHGRASKIEFDGHSYVVWQQNISDCIVHDPDCKCHKKD